MRVEAKGRNDRLSEIAAAWNKLHFTVNTEGDLTRHLLDKLNLTSLEMSDWQRGKLQSQLEAALDYLQRPSLDEYCKLKSAGLSWELVASPRATFLFSKAGLATNEIAEMPRHEALRCLWGAMNDDGQTSRFITGISLDGVDVASAITNSVSAMTSGKLSKGMTVLKEAFSPIHFSLGHRQNSAKTKLFVNLSFYARSERSTNAGPVYLSLEWSERAQTWRLSRLFTENLLNLDLMF